MRSMSTLTSYQTDPILMDTRLAIAPRSEAIKPRKAPAKAKPKRKRAPKFIWRKRDAQDSQYYNLQLDVNDLKQQIQELTQYRTMLYARVVNTKPLQPVRFLQIVDEYLRVFRHGMNPAPPEVDVYAFLREIMAPDIWINEFRGGIDLVMDQWKVYATCFADIRLEGISSIILPIEDPCGRTGYVVRVVGSYSGNITPNTLAIMFPHVLQYPHLVTQLIGRELVGSNNLDFVFDCQTNRILRCDVNVNFFDAFAKVLPRPQDLSIVFNGAKLESDFYVGETDLELVERSRRDEKPFEDLPPKAMPSMGEEDGTRSPSSVTSPGKMDLVHILS